MKFTDNPVLLFIKYLFRYVFRPMVMLARRTISGMKTYSHAGQDLLVVLMFNGKRCGYYLEIGAQDPIKNSNTFLLESDYGWRGVSFELRKDFSTFFSYRRKNLCIQADAAAVNYLPLLKEKNFPNQIDFLQVDIEPAEATLAALKQLPHEHYRFSLIIFEHDCYQAGSAVKRESRLFLASKGYKIFAQDVQFRGLSFEDWWIDPRVFPIFECLHQPIYSDTDYDVIIRTLPELLRNYRPGEI